MNGKRGAAQAAAFAGACEPCAASELAGFVRGFGATFAWCLPTGLAFGSALFASLPCGLGAAFT